MNDQGALNCQGVKFREEYCGAVGGLVTAKVVEHNKPADSLAMSRKSNLFSGLVRSHPVSYAKS